MANDQLLFLALLAMWWCTQMIIAYNIFKWIKFGKTLGIYIYDVQYQSIAS